MTLALVIPVRNDQDLLERLLAQAMRLGIFDQIIVVDDGSDPAIVVPDTVTCLRHPVSLGPGAARNTGARYVRTTHLLFFDSDDELTPELVPLWSELQGQAFDFCLFRHADSRSTRHKGWSQMPLDEAHWQAAGLSAQALAPVSDAARGPLSETANYPWNKIYRTGFLAPDHMQFPDIFLHEDIRPHWMSFLHAGRILASGRVCALHHVAPHGTRMTNQRSLSRLDLFGSLGDILHALRQAPATRAVLLPAFLNFTGRLLDWIHGNIDPAHLPALAARRAAFWQSELDPDLEAELRMTDPVLALHLALQMAEARPPC